ncbi:ShlB/FhaC/HecB family hemolysin secretion/activation protein [Methylobacterium brachythecii]|uniref:ShlB/FhaC/HecB family hemolysin secretion/activation protein n=1 Tax=Methylobacterium brachythecii TaxID=1176177 RepID=UPI00160D1122
MSQRRSIGAACRLSGLALAALTAMAGLSRVEAQTASQVTPQSFAPPAVRPGGTLAFSGQAGLAAPAGSDRLSIRVGTIVVENAPPGFAPEIAELQAKLVGRRVPVSEIFSAAQELEAVLVRRGSLLIRVVLPAQKLNDGGRLRLVVVNGFIQNVELRNVPEPARSRIAAVLDGLVGRRDLQTSEIERRLLLAGDTPGVSLRSTLVPSTSQGGATLVIDGTYRAVTGFVGGDNTVGKALGGYSIGTGLDINTAFGLGETLYVRALGYPGRNDALGTGSPFGDDPRLRTLSGGLVMPLGTDGMTFNVEYTDSRTAPKVSNVIQTTSDYERLSFRLRYPWLRSRTANFFSEVAFDATREELGLVLPAMTVPLSLDRLRIVRLSGEGDVKLDSGGIISGRSTLSLGIDGLGARGIADATPILPLSRLGANAEFQKLDTWITLTQPLPEGFVFGFYARGQTSFGQPLVRSEQMAIASFQELSTFDAGSLGGDSGWLVRSEVAHPFSVNLEGRPATVSPYVFGATGQLFLERPTILEASKLDVSSVGLGLRLAALLDPTSATEANLTLEFGRRFRSDALPDANRFTVLGSIRF